MARGHQKEQSRERNAKKAASSSKSKVDQRASAAKSLHYTCNVCRTQMPDPKTYKQHFENKHPKLPLPPECSVVEDG